MGASLVFNLHCPVWRCGTILSSDYVRTRWTNAVAGDLQESCDDRIGSDDLLEPTDDVVADIETDPTQAAQAGDKKDSCFRNS